MSCDRSDGGSHVQPRFLNICCGFRDLEGQGQVRLGSSSADSRSGTSRAMVQRQQHSSGRDPGWEAWHKRGSRGMGWTALAEFSSHFLYSGCLQGHQPCSELAQSPASQSPRRWGVLGVLTDCSLPTEKLQSVRKRDRRERQHLEAGVEVDLSFPFAREFYRKIYICLSS